MFRQFLIRLQSATASRGAALVSLVLLVLGALAMWLADPIPVQSLRLAQFDQFQRWHPRAPTPVAVQVVDIDEASLKDFGQWPWPRTRLAELVQRLHEAGAAVIAFDVLLAEADRTSPQAMAHLWQSPQASALLQTLPDHDELLARALTGNGVVLGSSLSRSGAPVPLPAPLPGSLAPPYRIVTSGTPSPAPWLHAFDTVVWALPALQASAAGVGAMNFVADHDGVLRRVPVLLRVGDQMLPTLSAEALRVAQGARNYLLKSNEAGVQEVRIGSLAVPTNAQGEIWLHYAREPAHRFISAAQILSNPAAVGALTGQIVLVGSSAAGLMDLRFNPQGQLMPGVQAHALALEQMLTGQYLQRPAWAAGAEALALVLGTLVVGGVALVAPVGVSALLAASVLGVMLGGAWGAFVLGHVLLDAANPALVVLLGFGLASGIQHRVSERERRWISHAFSRYVSPNRVAHLMAHPEQLQLSGLRQVCSFVFTDLAGFTAMMEGCDPADVVVWLNDYLEALLVIVFRHDGTLERFMGDAVAVLFSAPVAQPDHRQRALDCALEIDAFAAAYADRLQAQGVPWGHTRIGVHTGEVIVGNFGGKTLFDYRALGDPINTAARLESVNKHLGSRVCVSREILDGCRPVPVRAVGRLVLMGKQQVLQAYEPMAATDPQTCADLADYAAAMQLLAPGQAHQTDQALAAFMALAQRYPHDPLVALHLARLRQGATDDLIVLADK
jgi:adenylate cyclase